MFMLMSAGEELDSSAAIDEIRFAGERVRSRARRWAVRYWLSIGVASAAFYAALFLIDAGLWLPLGWLAVCLPAFGLQERRRDVIDPEQSRLAGRLFATHLGLALVVILANHFIPDASLGWAAPLGAIPAAPFCYGAWHASRR
jgi:hypothetical protein